MGFFTEMLTGDKYRIFSAVKFRNLLSPGKTVMCLSLSRPDLVESLIVEDISPRVSSSIGLIPNFIEAMKRAELSSPDLSLSQVSKLNFNGISQMVIIQ